MKKYSIEMEYEQVSAIVVNELFNDYKSINDDIRRLMANRKELESYEKEDLTNNLTYKAAYEIILQYYLPREEYIKKMSKFS